MCAYITIISMSLPGPVPDFGLGIMEKADSNLFDISWTGVDVCVEAHIKSGMWLRR